MDDIRERLKAARVRLDETQSAFARRFPVDQALYNRWETGERNPSEPSRALIERVLAELERTHVKRKRKKKLRNKLNALDKGTVGAVAGAAHAAPIGAADSDRDSGPDGMGTD